jgi:hypothetical protein
MGKAAVQDKPSISNFQLAKVSPLPRDLLSFLFLHFWIKASACSLRNVEASMFVEDIRIKGSR